MCLTQTYTVNLSGLKYHRRWRKKLSAKAVQNSRGSSLQSTSITPCLVSESNLIYPMPDVFLPPWASILTDSSHFNRLFVAILGETNCCVKLALRSIRCSQPGVAHPMGISPVDSVKRLSLLFSHGDMLWAFCSAMKKRVQTLSF